MKNKLPFLILITLALFSCKNKKENKAIDSNVNKEKHEIIHQKENKHWTYEGETGPEHWVEIEKESEENLQFSGGGQIEQFGELKKMKDNAFSNKQSESIKQKPIISKQTVGRNDTCPCGSGKKYKKCCGR